MTKTLTIVALPFVLSLAAGCVDGTATDGEYLFGLTADEVLTAKRVARTDLTDAAWLDAHRGDFSCSRYGGLCAEVGRDPAAEIIELGYRMALDGADRDAVVAAQADAITAARATRGEVAADDLYATTTSFFFGGSNNHRLKVVAHATEMWPSLELRASGECVTQRNAFGWLPAASDSISGSMTATWSNLPVEIDNGPAVTNANTLTFGPRQHDANTLRVVVTCAAVEEGWNARGSASQSI